MELVAFKSLTISREGEIIHFTHVSPDDYEKDNY